MAEPITANMQTSPIEPKASMKKSTVVSLLVGVLILAGGGGFYGGLRYEKQKLQDNPQEIFSAIGTANGARQFPGGSNANRAFRGSAFGGGVRGTIENISGTTMTVKSEDGSSKIVIVPSSASVTKSTTGTTADLTTGTTVMVTGNTNDDGSVTATNIQLNPALPTGTPPTGSDTSAS
jgi:hypothetical protein